MSLLLLSRSVVSDSFWPRGLQLSRLPCPSPSCRACSNSRPLSWWYHQTISYFVDPFSSCLQSFPASGSFLMSWLFASGVQSIGTSAWACPSNEYSGLISFTMKWFDLAVEWTLKSLLQHQNSKTSTLQSSAFFMVQLSHPYMTTKKAIALTRWTFAIKVMSLIFNKLFRLVIAFLLRSKCL